MVPAPPPLALDLGRVGGIVFGYSTKYSAAERTATPFHHHPPMNPDRKSFLLLAAAFALLWSIPAEAPRFQGALAEACKLAKWYAHEHVLLCLLPAFFIAGGIGVFVRQEAVLAYFGPRAKKWLAYTVAATSGTVLAVCSCTVLPLFGGIYLRGAGLGPAVAFLYSGPAINVLAIVLTARVLGWRLGVARGAGAILFSVVIGLLMHLLFRKEEQAKAAAAAAAGWTAAPDKEPRPLWQTALFFGSLVGILVFANWARPALPGGFWGGVFAAKWWLTAGFGLALGGCLWRLFRVPLPHLLLAGTPATGLALLLPDRPEAAMTAGAAGLAALTWGHGRELAEWREQSWGFAKQILPLLFAGVLAAGFFLGSPGSQDAGIIPNAWIQALVGDSPAAALQLLGHGGGADSAIPAWLAWLWPLWTNFFASFAGALMYFATLTEVPILRGLLDSGMGQGPALALLLAGPALSLPSMLVLNSILGPKKTLAFIGLVVGMATISGLIYGVLVR
ncbi:MAG: permease [Lentisphaeria bacterium]|jgi:hypothetical protein